MQLVEISTSGVIEQLITLKEELEKHDDTILPVQARLRAVSFALVGLVETEKYLKQVGKEMTELKRNANFSYPRKK